LTLDSEELTALIEFVADNVEPLATGARRYLVLDGSDERRLDIVRQVLDDPDREQLLDVLVRERLVPDDLRRGLEHRARCAAVDEFATLLFGNHPESVWQRWFEDNDWVLGSDFVRVVDERPIDVGHIADYLMKGFDGFLDVVEIKRPGGGLRFWAPSRDHGNPIPHTDLIKAISQAHRYLYGLEARERFAGLLAVGPLALVDRHRRDDAKSPSCACGPGTEFQPRLEARDERRVGLAVRTSSSFLWREPCRSGARAGAPSAGSPQR